MICTSEVAVALTTNLAQQIEPFWLWLLPCGAGDFDKNRSTRWVHDQVNLADQSRSRRALQEFLKARAYQSKNIHHQSSIVINWCHLSDNCWPGRRSILVFQTLSPHLFAQALDGSWWRWRWGRSNGLAGCHPSERCQLYDSRHELFNVVHVRDDRIT